MLSRTFKENGTSDLHCLVEAMREDATDAELKSQLDQAHLYIGVSGINTVLHRLPQCFVTTS